jgi:hypothetical protein
MFVRTCITAWRWHLNSFRLCDSSLITYTRTFSRFYKYQRSTSPSSMTLENMYKGKGKGHPRTSHKGPEGEKMYRCTHPWTSVLDGSRWSTSRPGRFSPGKDPVPIVWGAGWAPGSVWTGAENLALTEIRSADHPARSYTDCAIPATWKLVYRAIKL